MIPSVLISLLLCSPPEATFREAERLSREGRLADAHTAFRAFADADPRSPHASKALFNAAVLAERLTRYELAGQVFERIVRQYPQSEVAEPALFALANLHERAANLAAAAAAFESYARRYPKSVRAADALVNAALLKHATSDDRAAVALVDMFERRYAKREERAQLVLRAAGWVEAWDKRAATRRYERILKRHREPAVAVAAATRLGVLTGRSKWFERAVETGGDSALGAEAAFALAERAIASCTSKPLGGQNAKALAGALRTRVRSCRKAEAAMMSVIERKVARFSQCAMVRIGGVYEAIATDIRKLASPIPGDEPERAAYDAAIRSVLQPMDERARTAYQAALRFAHDGRLAGPCVVENIQAAERMRVPIAAVPLDDVLTSRLRPSTPTSLPLATYLAERHTDEKSPEWAAAQLRKARAELAAGLDTRAGLTLGRLVAGDHGEAALLLGLLRHEYRDASAARAAFEVARRSAELTPDEGKALDARIAGLSKR